MYKWLFVLHECKSQFLCEKNRVKGDEEKMLKRKSGPKNNELTAERR
jgi:hypothetical protein